MDKQQPEQPHVTITDRLDALKWLHEQVEETFKGVDKATRAAYACELLRQMSNREISHWAINRACLENAEFEIGMEEAAKRFR
ncbi:hypothetical protein [Type-E symbiont of Plautia stali]|uniref:hypothetical protein n=1 Tax=Type-E symbiont of Plautia stali TaxID=1560357 RepID=UPI00073E86E9|nr:hypothetical protein [Type-E symbiont of Plautia stali]